MRRVPAQRFDSELLDGPIGDVEELRANLQEIALANRLLLSNRAVLRRLEQWIECDTVRSPVTILDVATGGGGLPRAIVAWARRRGDSIRLVASDIAPGIMAVARQVLEPLDVNLVQHNALQMPFTDASIDIVTCAFSLHHFSRDAAIVLLREMARVARLGVIVTDLRRSYGSYWGARLLALGPINRLSRHDGPLSVLRAYTPAEARVLVDEAGIQGHVYAEPAFRLAMTLEASHVLAGQ